MALEIRWMEGAEAVEKLNPILAERGWSLLNEATSRALAMFDGDRLVAFFVLQLFPVLGPAWVAPSDQGGGVLRELADKMHEYLNEVQARGYLVICDSPVSERLALRHFMTKVEAPVYLGKGS
jgi:hypothetical protein